MESLPNPPRDKARKKALIADRALADLQEWLGRGALAFAMNGSRSENS
jgi:hypothetical protein